MNPDIKITSGRDSNVKSSGEVKGRPSSAPDSKKDFRKVLDKEGDDEENPMAANEIIEETDGTALAALAGTSKKKPALSPFDLSGRAPTTPFIEKSSQNENNRLQSPAELYGKIGSAEKAPLDKAPVILVDDSKNVDVNLSVVDKDTFTTRFATEQTDLSYVNPLAAVTPQQPSINLNITSEKPIIPTSNIQDIINQMIDKVTEIKDTGKTETVVTLKYPPLFEGAKIIVTSFDNAKKEFNITIENLTQQAKGLVDMQANRDNLLLALNEKGYAVHIMTTTTTTEERIVDALPQEGRSRGDEQREGRQQGKKREGDQN